MSSGGEADRPRDNGARRRSWVLCANPATYRVDQASATIVASADRTTLRPNNGATVALAVTGTISDLGSGVDPAEASYTVIDEYGQVQPSGEITLAADGSFTFAVGLEASRQGQDKDGRLYQIVIRALDRAGNEATRMIDVLVPHDRGK